MKERPLLVASVGILLILTFFHFVGYLITDLVNNSSISLNLQNISGLTFESGYGLFIISLILASYWFIAAKFFHVLFSMNLKQKGLIFSSGIAGLLYSLIHWFAFGQTAFEISLFFFLYLAAYWYFHSKKQDHFSFQHLLFVMCFYAVFATFLLNRANSRIETEKRNLLAVKLATKRNPVTEVLYEQLERKLIADSLVRSYFEPSKQAGKISQDQLIDHIRVQYFKDYWQKYSIQITLCDSAKELRIQPQGYLVNCNTYFRGTINSFGEATLMPNLHFLDYGFGKEYYLAMLTENQFNYNTPAQKSIVIELNLINAYPDPGYPGLLMDKTRIDLPNLSDYSYGLFQNGRLVHSVGSYNYRMELDQYQNFAASSTAFTDDRMIHYQYPVNESNSLLISMKERSFLTLITPFSYLFILFAVIALIGAGVINFRNNRHILPKSLRNRLHLSLLGILILTLLVIGIVQVINIININSKKNLLNLREKAYSIQIEVQHRYGNMPDIQEETKKELGYFLIKLSNVFFTDINFYNEKGELIASSRPQIFEEGLVSKQMNPDAFTALVVEGGSAFIHNESIGSMHFSSAYLPLYNEQGSLLGYINLPYFSRQDELKREISTFLVTFLNIYILLLLFGVFVTILISNYITAPLSMLAGKMSRLRLGIVNEKITWYHDDEIGQLVSEYNRMIDELARSAEMLARSERESAWREMARQVAHEIKNPLTPMKLSAQHLQKAWVENAPDMGERLNRFTRTLIEQIDTLSAIASDFSSFAKMPVVVNERINLDELINFVLSMYKDTSEITYDFQSEIQDPHLVADRALLIRIFTNLLNNAVQAIGEKPGGRITLRLFMESELFVVTVNDNGSGISFERAAKIFQPDFTTKTGGMGLGLAIVKGIITSMKGEISFTSAEDIGTTFIIKIPTDVTHN
jgi:signal transduction histidine kinase